ncbi:MAG: DUF2085 domain-containing protein [Bacteroidota bacterium]
MNLSRTTYCIIFFASLIWSVAITMPPVALHFGATGAADFLYGFFSRVCHQLDSHSLHLFDAKFAVCARCTAIYYGFFVSVVLYPFLMRKILPATGMRTVLCSPRNLFLSALPILLDLGLSEIGVHESTLVTRVVTGAILGLALPFILMPPAEEALRELRLSSWSSFLGGILHAK